MPTIFVTDGYSVQVFTQDHEPPHVHVFTGDCEVIIFLNCPDGVVSIREEYGCKSREVRGAAEIVKKHQARLCRVWKEIHGVL